MDIDTLRNNSGIWHKSCRKTLSNCYLPQSSDEQLNKEQFLSNVNIPLRLSLRLSNVKYNDDCFFCGKSESKPQENMRMFKCLDLQKKVVSALHTTNDKVLLVKFELGGDLVSNKCMYHLICLTNLYNQEKKLKSLLNKNDHYSLYKSVAFFDIINFIKYGSDSFSMPLQEIYTLYLERLKILGYPMEEVYKNITIFKEKIISEIPSIVETKRGRNVILSNQSAIQDAVNIVSSYDSDAKILFEAAKIVRRDLFLERNLKSEVQTESVPDSLISLVSMILGDSNVEDIKLVRQSALTIAQLIKFNSTKRIYTQSPSKNLRHSKEQETPIVKDILEI